MNKIVKGLAVASLLMTAQLANADDLSVAEWKQEIDQAFRPTVDAAFERWALTLMKPMRQLKGNPLMPSVCITLCVIYGITKCGMILSSVIRTAKTDVSRCANTPNQKLY